MVKRIYVPTLGPAEWQRLLADPSKQWKTGYSARTLAHCWEAANGWPPEVTALLKSSAVQTFNSLELLLAIPEYKVELPPRGHPSQNDLFVLAKACDGQHVTITVEGKVGESFGPTLEKWKKAASKGKEERLRFIIRELGLPDELPSYLRYQLLHRTASALHLARLFNSRHAVMLVHSFSPTHAWFGDFRSFIELFGIQESRLDTLYGLGIIEGIDLYAGWASGDPRFLTS